MVKMGKTISSGLQDNSKNQPVDASKITDIKMRMDNAGCAGEIKERKDLAMDGRARKAREELLHDVSEFNGMYSGSIIKNALRDPTANADEIKAEIAKLDTFVEGELLLAIEQVSDLKALTGKAFLDFLDRLDVDIACALLYEIRITGNVASLTDNRLFTGEAALFFNRLGAEPASEWFNSIGMTGNVSALTGGRAFGIGVLGAIGGNAKIAGELSYAIGVTGKVDVLTDSVFLDSLKGLKPDAAAGLLSRIWYTRSTEGLASRETIGRIASGELDVWDDSYRIKDGRNSPTPIVIAKLGSDGHDRGAKLIAQSLSDSGLSVLYVDAKNPDEISGAAKKVGAKAIGLSMMDDSCKGMATVAAERAKSQGIKIFGGGAITQNTSKSLQQVGMKMFGASTTKEDLLGFLGASTSRPYIQANINHGLIGLSEGSAPVHMRQSIVISAQAGQNTINLHLRPELGALDEEELRKRRRARGTGVDAHVHAGAGNIQMRKGLKMQAPISWDMDIFGKFVDEFKRFNSNRRDKSIERLLSRSEEFGSRLEAEAKRLGIDLRSKPGNHYEALGLKYTADRKAIKEAYHALVKRHHPDISKDIDAEEKMKKINEAYAVLKDSKLKEEYDQNSSKGRNGISATASRGISAELMKRYREMRDRDFKKFEETTSVPLQKEAIRSAIEEVCDWNGRFDKAVKAAFGDLRDYGRMTKKLESQNRKLMQKETTPATLAKLRENGRRLGELMLIYGEAEKSISAVKMNVKKEIGAQETRITKRLSALI